jgi:hypothetical protein
MNCPFVRSGGIRFPYADYGVITARIIANLKNEVLAVVEKQPSAAVTCMSTKVPLTTRLNRKASPQAGL